MVDDLRPTLDGIRRAIMEYGSIAHLAAAMGVPTSDLEDWYYGHAEMPPEHYRTMLLIVTEWKATKGKAGE